MNDSIDEGLFYAFIAFMWFFFAKIWYTLLEMIFSPTTLLEKAVIGLLAAIAGFFLAALLVVSTIFSKAVGGGG